MKYLSYALVAVTFVALWDNAVAPGVAMTDAASCVQRTVTPTKQQRIAARELAAVKAEAEQLAAELGK